VNAVMTERLLEECCNGFSVDRGQTIRGLKRLLNKCTFKNGNGRAFCHFQIFLYLFSITKRKAGFYLSSEIFCQFLDWAIIDPGAYLEISSHPHQQSTITRSIAFIRFCLECRRETLGSESAKYIFDSTSMR
jgi:hypothetical protein